MEENSKLTLYRCLSRNFLKYMAIVLMLLDHITEFFIPNTSSFYLPFRFVARLTATIMCYFIACGYQYTHDLKKYMIRMSVFAIISAVPFAYMTSSGESWLPIAFREGNCGHAEGVAAFKYIPSLDKTLTLYFSSVMTTFLLSLIAIWVLDRSKLNSFLKVVVFILILYVASFCDWKYWAILYCTVFYFFRDKSVIKWVLFLLVSLFYIFDIGVFSNLFDFTSMDRFLIHGYRVGVLLAFPILAFLLNNNSKSVKKIKTPFAVAFNKWFFYAFYPVHILILDIIYMMVK